MTSKIKKSVISIIVALNLFSTQVNAFFGFFDPVGATEYTQILNNLQLADQTYKMAQELSMQIKQFQKWKEQMLAYKMMLQNIGQYTDKIKLKFEKEFLKIGKAFDRSMAISATSNNIVSEFNNRFKGYEEWQNLAKSSNLDFSKEYKNFSDTTRDTILGTFKALNIQENELKNDNNFIQFIHNKMTTAKGQKELTSIANELVIHQTQRLKSLQKTIITQANMQVEYIAKETEEKALIRAKNRAWRDKADLSVNPSNDKNF